jgi:hypothetical protein
MAIGLEQDLQHYREYQKHPLLKFATDILERTREPLMETRVAISVAVQDGSAVAISAANTTEAVLFRIYPSGWLKAAKLPTKEAQVAFLLGKLGVNEKLKEVRAEKLPNNLGEFVGIVGNLLRPPKKDPRTYSGF